MERETFAHRLRRLRIERGWSQLCLAAKAGLSPATISILETGRRKSRGTNVPRLLTVAKLTRALGGNSLAFWDGLWC
jgi:transcriptional regulator with XRE-family HTH domain